MAKRASMPRVLGAACCVRLVLRGVAERDAEREIGVGRADAGRAGGQRTDEVAGREPADDVDPVAPGAKVAEQRGILFGVPLGGVPSVGTTWSGSLGRSTRCDARPTDTTKTL